MTRLEALRKLIAIEPITKEEMYVACGWHRLEFNSILNILCSSGEVTWINKAGHRFYMVK